MKKKELLEEAKSEIEECKKTRTKALLKDLLSELETARSIVSELESQLYATLEEEVWFNRQGCAGLTVRELLDEIQKKLNARIK